MQSKPGESEEVRVREEGLRLRRIEKYGPAAKNSPTSRPALTMS
jgi:hypothetical protein